MATVPLGFPFYTPCLLLLVPPCAKHKWVYAPSGKGTCLGIREIEFLHLHLAGGGLKVLIVASYITTDSMVLVFPIIQSVNNQMYICIEYS